jgi:hypothetical protein
MLDGEWFLLKIGFVFLGLLFTGTACRMNIKYFKSKRRWRTAGCCTGGNFYMAKRTKKPNIYQIHQSRHFESQQRAGSLKTRFPGVTGIIVCRTVTPDQAWKGQAKTYNYEYGPENKAFFQYGCHYRDCVGGYLDLDREIAELVSAGATTHQSKQICDGWEAEDRINKNKCLLRNEYSIAITYAHTP